MWTIHCIHSAGVGGSNSTRNYWLRWRIPRCCQEGSGCARHSPVGHNPCSCTWDRTPGDKETQPGPVISSHNHSHHPTSDIWNPHLWDLSPGTRKDLQSLLFLKYSSAFLRDFSPVWGESCGLPHPESGVYSRSWEVCLCGREHVLISGQKLSQAPLVLPGPPVGISCLIHRLVGPRPRQHLVYELCWRQVKWWPHLSDQIVNKWVDHNSLYSICPKDIWRDPYFLQKTFQIKSLNTFNFNSPSSHNCIGKIYIDVQSGVNITSKGHLFPGSHFF